MSTTRQMRNAAKSKPRTTRQARKIALQPPAPAGTALLARPDPDVSLPEKMEELLIGGNLGAMSSEQRVVYYNKLCKSLGLNPLTRPFEYLVLNGKMVLYALRACTEQLRKIHGVSVTKETRKIEDEHCIVDVEVMDRTGRTDTGTGVVWIGNLKGDNYANALMKASTKAKRRATLSIVGLGFLDESELDTMRGAFKRVTPAGRIIEDVEPENKYLDAYHEREQKELSRLTPAQREIVERKMKGGDAACYTPKPATSAANPSAVESAMPTVEVRSSSGGSTEPANQATSAVPCLFYKFFEQSETYEISGSDELKTKHRDLLKSLWNPTSRTIVATPEQLGRLISRFEDLHVPFRELK